MANDYLASVIRQASILGIIGVLCGCGGTSVNQDVFMGEGFQTTLPDAEARVLVWGNHSGAMTRTLAWLNENQIPAVDPSWIEKEITDPIFARRPKMEQRRQVLAAAKSVGASLVLFTQVEDSQMGWKFDVMSFGHKRTKFIGVQIRGMKTETGDVLFGAKAWNSEPLAASEQLVMDLTTFALEKAFRQSQPSIPIQPDEQQSERPDELVAGVSSSPDEEMSYEQTAYESTDDQFALPAQVPAAVLYAGSEDTTGIEDTTSPVPFDDNRSEVAGQPFLSLSQNGLQRGTPGTFVADLSAPRDEDLSRMIPASQPIDDQPTIRFNESSESIDPEDDEDQIQSDSLPMGSVTDDGPLEADPQLDEETSDDGSSVGLQIASGALSILYAPIKVTYAIFGGFFGGFAYILTAGNESVAQTVWDASLQGDYWVTAEHLRGEDPIQFKGKSSSLATVQQVHSNAVIAE